MKTRTVTRDLSSKHCKRCIAIGWIKLLRLTCIVVSLHLRTLQELIVFLKQTIKIKVASKVKAQAQVST